MACQYCCLLTGSDGSAWDSWLKGAFQSALAAAPLDMAEAWATAVRFAVNALAYTNPAGMHAVLQVIIQQPSQGKLLCRDATHVCGCCSVGCTGLVGQQCESVHAVEPTVVSLTCTIEIALWVLCLHAYYDRLINKVTVLLCNCICFSI